MSEQNEINVNNKKTVISDICLLALVGAVILTPYFLNINFEGNDTVFHYRCIEVLSRYSFPDIIRGMYLKNEILHGMLMDNFTGNTGYGAGIFYPPFSHVAVVIVYKLLSFTGISLIAAFRITGILCMILSGESIYFLCRMVTKHSADEKQEKGMPVRPVLNPAFVASVLYMTALYHISDHMSRDAIAECWVFVFIPIMFISIIFLMRDEFRSFLISFVISCVGLLHSHLVMTVYMALLFGIAILISIRYIAGEDKTIMIKRIAAIISGLLIACIISAPFFVRLLQNRRGASYYVFDGDMTTVELLNRNRMTFSDFFIGMKNGNIAVHCNLVFMALFFTALVVYFYFGKNEKLKRLKKEMRASAERKMLFESGVLFFFLSCILSSVLINWNIMPHFLRMIQFPWRLLVFQIFGMSIIVMILVEAYYKLYEENGAEAYVFKKLKVTPKNLLIILLISCAAYTMIEQFSNYMLVYDRDYRDNLTVYDYNDYLPMNSLGKYIDEVDSGSVYISGNNPSEIKKVPAISSETETMVFKIDKAEIGEGEMTVEIPRLYYQGYTIEAEDKAHNISKIPYYETERGFIGINVPAGSVVTVRFTGTKEEITANRISLVAFIVFMLYCTLGYFMSVRNKTIDSINQSRRLSWQTNSKKNTQ